MYKQISIAWASDAKNPILQTLLRFLQIQSIKYTYDILPRGKYYYKIYQRNISKPVMNEITKLVQKISLSPMVLNLSLDLYENELYYIQDIRKFIEHYIQKLYSISVTSIEEHTYIYDNEKIISFAPYSDIYRIYEPVLFDINTLKGYTYITYDPLYFYLDPIITDDEDNRLEIKLYHDIFSVKVPKYDSLDEKRKFDEQIDIIRSSITTARDMGFLPIVIPPDTNNQRDILILRDIAEMWGFEYYLSNVNGEDITKYNIIVFKCHNNACKEFLKLFPKDLHYERNITLPREYDYYYTGNSIDPSYLITEWFLNALEEIKIGGLPRLRISGSWQHSTITDTPKIIATIIRVYLELFPEVERWPIEVSDDLSIYASFSTHNEYNKFITLLNSRLDNMYDIDYIEKDTWVDAVLLRLSMEEKSLIISYRSKWYVVFIRSVPLDTMSKYKSNAFISRNTLKDKLIASLSNDPEETSFEKLIEYLENEHGKEALSGYVHFSNFKGHINKSNMPYTNPLDGNINIISQYDEHRNIPLQTVTVKLKDGDTKDLFTIATDDKEKLKNIIEPLWNKGWLMNLFGSEVMRVLKRMPAYFGAFEPFRNSSVSLRHGTATITYLENLVEQSKTE